MRIWISTQKWGWGGNDLCLASLHYTGKTPLPIGQPSSQQPASGMQEKVTGPSSSEEEFPCLAGEETVHEKWWQGVRRRRQVRKHFHLFFWGQWAPIRELQGLDEWPIAGGAALCGCSPVDLTGQLAGRSPTSQSHISPSQDNSA